MNVTMRLILALYLVIAILMTIIIVKLFTPNDNDTRYYGLKGQVEDIIGDKHQVVDSNRNIWEFSNTSNEYPIGTEVLLVMDSQNTEQITDDIIVNIYCIK